MVPNGKRGRVSRGGLLAAGLAACCMAALLGIWLLSGHSSQGGRLFLTDEDQRVPQATLGATEVREEAKKAPTEDQRTWAECGIPVPEGHGELWFLRGRAHPFLAEYDRKLRFVIPKGNEAVRWLPPNVGGRTMINCYWYPAAEDGGPYVRLEDHWGVYVADLRRQTVSVVGERHGQLYIAEIPVGRDNPPFGHWEGEIDREELTYYVGNNPGHELTGCLAQGKGEYLGRLDGRSGPVGFVSRAEAPKESIERVR